MAANFCARSFGYFFEQDLSLIRKDMDQSHLVRLQFNMKPQPPFRADKMFHIDSRNTNILQVLDF